MLATLRGLCSSLLPRRGSGERATDDRDWRLRAAFDDAKGVGVVYNRLRGREEVLGSEVGGLLPFGVVLSRSGGALFVYASARSGIDSARRTIEGVAHTAGLRADVSASRWDGYTRAWRQVDPPLTDRERELDEVRAREAMRHKTCEFSFLVGRLDRVRVERLILDFAQRRGLACAVEEERRCFRVLLTFSVSGPAFMLEQFAHHADHVVRIDWSGGASTGA
jgi:hypothetical protein